MVGGKRPRSHLSAAVVADSLGDAPLPPPAGPQRARAGLLGAQLVVPDLWDEARLAHAPAPAGPATVDRRSESSSHSFMSQATCSSAWRRASAISRARAPSR